MRDAASAKDSVYIDGTRFSGNEEEYVGGSSIKAYILKDRSTAC